MMDPVDKAERCRARAEELRAAAADMSEQEAKAALIAVADSMEAHARTLEQAAVKFRVFRRGSVSAAAD